MASQGMTQVRWPQSFAASAGIVVALGTCLRKARRRRSLPESGCIERHPAEDSTWARALRLGVRPWPSPPFPGRCRLFGAHLCSLSRASRERWCRRLPANIVESMVRHSGECSPTDRSNENNRTAQSCLTRKGKTNGSRMPWSVCVSVCHRLQYSSRQT